MTINKRKETVGNLVFSAYTRIDHKNSIDHANSSRQIACCYLYFKGRRVLVLLLHTRLFLVPQSFNNFSVLWLKYGWMLENGLFRRFFRQERIYFLKKDVGPILTHSCRAAPFCKTVNWWAPLPTFFWTTPQKATAFSLKICSKTPSQFATNN